MSLDYLRPIDHRSDAVADLFDELPLWSAPFGMLLLDRVPLTPGACVLDLGAGTGFLTVELAQRLGPGARVIAVDPWEGAMKRLRRKVEALALGNVELLQMDAADLALPPGSVDLIVSNLGVNNFERAAAVLAACYRAARPGARLLISSNLQGHMAEFYAVFREVLIELGQAHRLPMLAAHVAHRGTVASVSALVDCAGFSVDPARLVEDSFRLHYASGQALLRHYFIRLGFLPAWTEIPDPDRLHATFLLLERRLDELAAREGGLSLTVPMVLVEGVKGP